MKNVRISSVLLLAALGACEGLAREPLRAGMTEAEVEAKFGMPDAKRNDPAAVVWIYRADVDHGAIDPDVEQLMIESDPDLTELWIMFQHGVVCGGGGKYVDEIGTAFRR